MISNRPSKIKKTCVEIKKWPNINEAWKKVKVRIRTTMISINRPRSRKKTIHNLT